MKKNEEQKKLTLGAVIAIIIILLIVILVARAVIKNKKQGGNDENVATQQYELPDTEYRDMKVSDITMEYLSANNETMVTMLITNTTANSIKDEFLTAYLINDGEEVIAQTQTFIKSIDPNGEYSISVILKGDLTSTTQIKLEKVEG